MTEIEERIGLEVYRANKAGEIIHRKALIERLESCGITKIDVDNCIDRMSDLGLSDEDWKTLDNGRWVRAIAIKHEYTPFFKYIDVHTKGMETHQILNEFYEKENGA